VHPTGRYNFNTLLEILKHDYGLPLVHSASVTLCAPLLTSLWMSLTVAS